MKLSFSLLVMTCINPPCTSLGGTLRIVPLKRSNFHFDFDALADAITTETRLLITNIPNNPTGATWTLEELDQLAAVVRETDALILSDEVYGPMVYDGQSALSILHSPALRERSLVTASFGKILHATGWKIGYIIAPENWTDEIRKVHQYDVFSTGAPFQEGIARFLSSASGQEHLSELAPVLSRKARPPAQRFSRQSHGDLSRQRQGIFKCLIIALSMNVMTAP